MSGRDPQTMTAPQQETVLSELDRLELAEIFEQHGPEALAEALLEKLDRQTSERRS